MAVGPLEPVAFSVTGGTAVARCLVWLNCDDGKSGAARRGRRAIEYRKAMFLNFIMMSGIDRLDRIVELELGIAQKY